MFLFLYSSQRLIEFHTDSLRPDAHDFTLDVDRVFDAGGVTISYLSCGILNDCLTGQAQR